MYERPIRTLGAAMPSRLLAAFRSVAVTAVLAIVASVAPTLHHQNPFAASGKADPALMKAAQSAGDASFSVIVRESTPASSTAEGLVRSLGGTVTHELSIIGGFSAQLPGTAVSDLVRSGSVLKVWGDGRVHMTGRPMRINLDTAPNRAWQDATKIKRAHDSHFNGSGVTVAILDTGLAQNADLGNRVLARIDLTSEADGLDHFGHGTHMAGIIAGDGSATGNWLGVAPKANLVSVKVAGANGATDVSVVIAGLQWIVSHENEYGIRILNLSFGTDSTQSYVVDPLDYAVEQAWFSGILVVVAAGNRGPDPGTINKPGDDPYVVTVGAAQLRGTGDRIDDVVASFSSRGPTQDGLEKPDLLAPGVTIVSNRAPGSTVDDLFPGARIGLGYFKGTGSSQSAAIVSGVAALMYQSNPSLTPDQAKAVLLGTTQTYMASQPGAGEGLIDANKAAWAAKVPQFYGNPNAGLTPSTGLGSLEASRGSLHVYTDLPGDGLGALDADGQADLVQGEIDIFGQPWSATGWAATGWAATGWAATGWAATGWAGAFWAATGWAATGWAATGWAATGWAATGWADDAWS